MLPHLGAFSARRKFHNHEGVDIYCDDETLVRAVEDGEIVVIEPFTGDSVGSPWWNETDSILIEGESGVVVYGEITPLESVREGSRVLRGQPIGRVKQVLRKFKGRPMAMLHLELHESGSRATWGWPADGQKPPSLMDPTLFLQSAKRS